MRFKRRRSDRPDPALWERASGIEVLEGRELLSASAAYVSTHPFSVYQPTDVNAQNPITGQPESIPYQELEHDSNPQSPLLNNQGKVVSGTDREGDEWTITVHGPGSVIVTDATPNDGLLDDNIATIQLIGTSIKDTYVTGTVTASPYVQSVGQVLFNKLIDQSGVKSIELNGFDLTQTVTPGNAPNNSDTGVFLYGGVGTLSFNEVLAQINPATGDEPIQVVIGDPTTPLKVKPNIEFGNVYNTVYNPSETNVSTAPQTVPTVDIVVNGVINDISMISTGQATPPTAGTQYQFPIVGTTGRTSVQATAINHLNVGGSATNLTASRSAEPFQSSLSGLKYLKTASFGGTADAVGLDVDGKIGKLKFAKGLGNPTGTSPAANQYGTPTDRLGYPANGLDGGLVTAKKIGAVKAGPANTTVQTAQNPTLVVTNSVGSATYYPQAGNALTSAAITSSGSIGTVAVKGNLQSSEIKSGFDYSSYNAGLEGTRAKSEIQHLAIKGNLISSDVSATYRPGNHIYGSTTSVKGPGKITGNVGSNDRLYNIGTTTPLLNMGTGFRAKTKKGYLPPPEKPARVDSVQVR